MLSRDQTVTEKPCGKFLYVKNKVRERTSIPQPLNLEGSEPDFARRRTAALLLSIVRRVHPPEGYFTQFLNEGLLTL